MNNYILVKIIGKNVNNYIKWLFKNKIEVIDLKVIKHNELKLLINNKDYDKLSKYSMTYKIEVLKKYGPIGLYDIVKSNIINMICLFLSICFLYLLSHIIFSVDIMYNDEVIVNKINQELAKYDIKRFSLKKNYTYLTYVKAKILNDNKDNIEWLEIEESGTRYIVRLVERKQEVKSKEYQYQSIVASKDATILSVDAYSGEKVKQINEYVKKNDIIISGIMTKSDDTKIYTKAQGKVLAETWYKATVEYPLYYQEERVTGKSKDVIAIYFLNYELPIFPYKKYKQFRKSSHILFENNIMPIKIVKEIQYEVNILEAIYTTEEAIQKAIMETKTKLQSQNNRIIDKLSIPYEVITDNVDYRFVNNVYNCLTSLPYRKVKWGKRERYEVDFKRIIEELNVELNEADIKFLNSLLDTKLREHAYWSRYYLNQAYPSKATIREGNSYKKSIYTKLNNSAHKKGDLYKKAYNFYLIYQAMTKEKENDRGSYGR